MTSSARFPVGRSHILLLQLPDHITFCLFHILLPPFFSCLSVVYSFYHFIIRSRHAASIRSLIYSLSEAVLKTILLFPAPSRRKSRPPLPPSRKSTGPFPLSCRAFGTLPFYPAMLQKTKNMMQNYYQIDAFTRHTVSLLEENGIPCILLKGISLAACYPVPEYRKLGDLDLYINEPESPRKSPSSPGSPGL